MQLDFIRPRRGFRCLPGRATARDVVRYITRYITRDVEDGDSGEHLVVWYRSKCGTTAFHWAGPLGRLRRLALDFLSGVPGEHREAMGVDRHYYDTRTPWTVLVRIGWELLTESERRHLLATSRAVQRWWYGPPGAGNDFEPF